MCHWHPFTELIISKYFYLLIGILLDKRQVLLDLRSSYDWTCPLNYLSTWLIDTASIEHGCLRCGQNELHKCEGRRPRDIGERRWDRCIKSWMIKYWLNQVMSCATIPVVVFSVPVLAFKGQELEVAVPEHGLAVVIVSAGRINPFASIYHLHQRSDADLHIFFDSNVLP